MPLNEKPECIKCNEKESLLWHSTDNGSICNDCFEKNKLKTDDEATVTNSTIEDDDKTSTTAVTTTTTNSTPSTTSTTTTTTTKSTRTTKYNGKPGRPPGNKNLNKGKGRRHIFKKTVCIFFFLQQIFLNEFIILFCSQFLL